MRTLASRALTALVAAAIAAAVSPGARADDDAPAKPEKKPAKGGKKAPAKSGRKPVTVDRVVAVVNDTIILESELYMAAAPLMGELESIQDPREKQRQFKALLRQVLETMIDDELIVQAAGEASLEVGEEEVDKAVAEVKKQNKLTDAQLEEALAMQGYTLAAYRRDVKKQILRLRAVNVLVRPNVSVTDDEVREKYDSMSRKAGAVTEIKLAHILVAVAPDASAEDKAVARRRAGELTERARGGESFAELALAASEDPSTKEAGGELGWFKRGELPSEWEDQLFNSDTGDVRGPIEGPRGYHVFVIVDAKKDKVKPFEEAKAAVREELYVEEMEKQTKLWLEELRRKAHIEIKL
jgi:parvulin-like peptidyl-prolyl isomerase